MFENFKEIAWKQHIVSLLMLAAGLALFVVSLIHYLDVMRSLKIADSDYHQQVNINREALRSMTVYRDHKDFYDQMMHAGIVGDPPRLQWIETTQLLSEQHRIPLIEFTLNSSEPLSEMNSQYGNSEFEMLLTPMTLALDLRHEDDFLRIFSGLSQHASGIFSIDQCELRRNPVAQGENSELAGMKGKCEISWYSIPDITAKWELSSR